MQWRSRIENRDDQIVTELGVTAIELLPIHAFLDERHLLEHGCANYWGYNSLCFFAPEQRYFPGNVRNAFRSTVAELHSAGNCLSVMLNIRAADTEYFLQAGFDPALASGLSPGYLHMGYAIEAACRDRIRVFEFLGGGGLHREYKRDFLAQPAQLTCWQILRQRRLQLAFRAYDWLSGISTGGTGARRGR